MDTFRGNLQLAALGDLDSLGWLIAGRGLGALDLLDNLIALQDLAEDDVLAIEPPCVHVSGVRQCLNRGGNLRGHDGGDEELRSVGVLARVGHGEEALLGVLELEVLIGELLTVDYRNNLCQQQITPTYNQLNPLLYVLDLPPVPSPLVKSPPWIMNCLMTRWKVDPS